jgi:anti-anti-sigma factor
MQASVMYITKRQDEVIDFNLFVFRLMAADVMDMDHSWDLGFFMKTLILGGARKVVVDMSGLEFVDSLGISMLIETAKLLRLQKGDLALVHVPPRIQAVFQPIKLNRFIKIFEEDDEVINFFRLV